MLESTPTPDRSFKDEDLGTIAIQAIKRNGGALSHVDRMNLNTASLGDLLVLAEKAREIFDSAKTDAEKTVAYKLYHTVLLMASTKSGTDIAETQEGLKALISEGDMLAVEMEPLHQDMVNLRTEAGLMSSELDRAVAVADEAVTFGRGALHEVDQATAGVDESMATTHRRQEQLLANLFGSGDEALPPA